MKVAFKAALVLGTFASLALCSVIHAAPSPGKAQATRGRCFAYPKDLVLQGYLAAGQEYEMFNWTTNCTAPTSTSVTGSGSIDTVLQQLVNGSWITLDSGFHLFANIGPGTYRVVMTNTAQARAFYTIRHGHGIG